MGQRLLRTRNTIAHAGISFQVPSPHRLAERTAGVLAVIYLLFRTGKLWTRPEPRPNGVFCIGGPGNWVSRIDLPHTPAANHAPPATSPLNRPRHHDND